MEEHALRLVEVGVRLCEKGFCVVEIHRIVRHSSEDVIKRGIE